MAARVAALATMTTVVMVACGPDPAQDLGPGSSFAIRRMTSTSPPAYDLLIVVDDSGSMAERQVVLPEATAEMVRRLIEPACVDAAGVPVVPPARADVLGRCPTGSRPERAPVVDMNVGVITTSLGAAGRGDRCAGDDGAPVDRGDARARLFARSSPGGVDDVPTWQGRGFLAWDPHQIRTCEPEGGGYCPGIASADELVARLQAIVAGVGAGGCGDESPLEASWRFLGDPEPPAHVDELGEPVGIDTDLLAQRADFLRTWSWSKLVIAIVSDEDDCSLRVDALGAYAADAGSPMPRPRAECSVAPDDPCCATCLEPVPEGCVGDGGCAAPGCSDPATCPDNFHPPGSPENDRERRCVDPTRRFGFDPRYPVERYVTAFTSDVVDPGRTDLVASDGRGTANPLALHDVHVVPVTAVPWPLIARRNADGEPDLVHGGGAEPGLGGYMTGWELVTSGAWEDLLPPPPETPPGPRRILELAQAMGGRASLASIDPPRFEPAGPGRGLDVGFDAALVGVRLGGCAERVGRAPRCKLGSSCFGPRLTPDAEGGVACHVIEATDSDGDRDRTTDGKCACDPDAARLDPVGGAARLAAWARETIDGDEAGSPYDCFCVIPQVEGASDDPTSDRHHCQHDEVPPPGVDGWCYVDTEQHLGDPGVVVSCPPDEKRLVRLVGHGDLRPSSTAFIACVDE